MANNKCCKKATDGSRSVWQCRCGYSWCQDCLHEKNEAMPSMPMKGAKVAARLFGEDTAAQVIGAVETVVANDYRCSQPGCGATISFAQKTTTVV